MTAPHSLKGLSGASLQLVIYGNNTLVRKTSEFPNGNDRLRMQMEKQNSFIKLGGPISAPAILDFGINSLGCFYFEMELVSGLDGHRFLERCSPKELHCFTEALISHLATVKSLPMIAKSGQFPTLFHSSLNKIVEIHHKNVGLSNEDAGLLLKRLQIIKDLEITREGFCHGDFTLENMLIDGNGKLHFVDFLDSAFEHPVQDFVKLSQDLHGGWFRCKGRRLSSAVIAHIEHAIQPVIDRDFSYYSNEVRNVLQSLNFCRILPYTSSDIQKEFVLNQIKKFINHIQ